MVTPLTQKFTLSDLRIARQTGRKIPFLTCYDATMARLMQEAGVPGLLVGDSAASVVLGYETTLPVSLEFMMEITAAVRRGAPLALVMADMPFGSYHQSRSQAIKNIVTMVQRTGCDCVKLEVTKSQAGIVKKAAEAGVAVVAHIGLRPQAVGVLGGYRSQGRTAREAAEIVALSLHMQKAGAAAILLEAVPGEVSRAVVEATKLPVIGCGAGPACHGCVIVTQDGLMMTQRRPKFVPQLGNAGEMLREAFGRWISDVGSQTYPADEHQYKMSEGESAKLDEKLHRRSARKIG